MARNERSSHIIVDIDAIENSLRNIKEKGSICKVEKHVGDVYDNCDAPVTVSIGPYHCGKSDMRAMEKKKWNFMEYVLKRNRDKSLRDYVTELRKIENTARSYYANEIKMESNDFVSMLLLDGFFILASLRAIDLTYDYQDLDALSMDEYSNNQLNALKDCFVTHDLLLIENQIPFFVLKIIYELFIGEENPASLSEQVSHYIEQILCHYAKAIKKTNKPIYFHHLLHLCHIYLKPSGNGNDSSCFMQFDRDGQTANCWRKALQYHLAGVKFQKREFDENKPHSLLDVRFINNVLEIPRLPIDENTPSLFKSLIALERTNPSSGNDITAYIIFISHLVKDAKDVALLVDKEIIEHDLCSEEEVANLFKKLGDGISFDFMGNFYLRSICHNLEAYYEKHMNWWNVWLGQTASSLMRRGGSM